MKRTDIQTGKEYLVTKSGRSPRGNRVDFKGVAVSATKDDTYGADVDQYPTPEWRGVRLRVTEVIANPDRGGSSWRVPADRQKPHDKHSIQGVYSPVEVEVGKEVVVPAMQILGTEIDLEHEKALRENERRDEAARRDRMEKAVDDRKRDSLERAERLGLVDQLYHSFNDGRRYERTSLSVREVLDIIEADRKNR